MPAIKYLDEQGLALLLQKLDQRISLRINEHNGQLIHSGSDWYDLITAINTHLGASLTMAASWQDILDTIADATATETNITFNSDLPGLTLLDKMLAHRDKITTVTTQQTSLSISALNGCTALTSLTAPALTALGSYALGGCTALTTLNAPALTAIGNNALQGCTALTTLFAPSLTRIDTQALYGHTAFRHLAMAASIINSANNNFNLTRQANLYDLRPGGADTVVSNLSLSNWHPVAPLATDQNALVPSDESDDPAQPINNFTCNLDKTLWYILHHLVPCLANRTGYSTCTLTLYTSVYSAIAACNDANGYGTAILNALAERNWAIASA